MHCISFGFKFGIPMEADLVFDVRCLPNPFYDEALRPLTGYGFTSIAWAAMSSALSHEREKQRRRPQTVSLEEPIPGCDGLTWGDTITQRNLPYTPYLSEAAL